MTNTATRRLTVATTPLRHAFEQLARLLPRRSLKTGELVLSFSAGTLFIEGPGATVEVPATGTWSGRARMSAAFTSMLAKSLPEGDPLTVEFGDGRVILRGASVIRLEAVWEDISPQRLEVAMDLTDIDLLKLLRRETAAALVSSGLEKLATGAERQFQRSVDRVCRALARYAVAREHVERAVRALIVGP